MSGILAPLSHLNYAQTARQETGRRHLLELKTSRTDIDTYFMMIAKTASLRSTCRHRQQGAVLVRDKRIIAAGYNGAPSGMAHCIDLEYCAKETKLVCRAEGLHGESNAVASAARQGVATNGATVYCIYSPCRACANLLKSAGVVEVKYLKLYEGFTGGPDYLKELGIKVSEVEMSEILSLTYSQG